MKIKKSLIVILLFMLCSAVNVQASSADIVPNVTIEGRNITISGYHYGSQPSDYVTLLVTRSGSVTSKEDILWADQGEVDDNQFFEFAFTFPERLESGEYKYIIGSNASSEIFEGTISYVSPIGYGINEIFNADITININNYVLTITGTLSCGEYKTVQLDIMNITDNVEVASEIITSDDGVLNLSYQLPSLIFPKEYSVTVVTTEVNQEQATVSFVIDSSVILVYVQGNVEVADDVYIDVKAKSLDSDIINKNVSFTQDESFYATLPNVVANASFHLAVQGYERAVNGPNPENIVKSENLMLYNALIKARPELDNGDEIITPEELARITGVLDLSNKNIYSIDGLQSCKKISHLYINNNHISDLTPICGLRNLFYLVADNNDLVEIPYLPKNLKLINIDKNKVEDALGIQELKDVEIIFASSNKLKSISWLAGKSKLRYLSLSSNRISDISPLADSNNLVHLNLAHNMIEDISVLHDNIYLKFLRLSYNQLEDVSSLPDVFYHCLYVEGNHLGYVNVQKFTAINLMYAASY